MHSICAFYVILICSSGIFWVSSESTSYNQLASRETEDNENECDDDNKQLKIANVIKLNVGGEIIMTTRATLSRVPNSTLSSMISGNCEDISGIDRDGNIFLDFNPVLFRHLLEQLRMLDDDESPTFYPPFSRLHVKAFKAMLEKLGLKMAPRSNDDIIMLNVGGEMMATRRNTITRIPKSNLARMMSSYQIANTDANGYLFLDYDPKLFSHLLAQLRADDWTNVAELKAPSNDMTGAFNAMLVSLGLMESTTAAPSTEDMNLVSEYAILTASNYCNSRKTACAPSKIIAKQLENILDPEKPSIIGWDSGAFAPQYIQLELTDEERIAQVYLQVSQIVEGSTHHQLLVGREANNLRVVKELVGKTKNYQWLNITFNPPLEKIRFFRVNTVSSPTFVSWLKLLVYG